MIKYYDKWRKRKISEDTDNSASSKCKCITKDDEEDKHSEGYETDEDSDDCEYQDESFTKWYTSNDR